ncbi:MAG: stage V sporulation protein AD [Bacillota bacterium]|nr:stage V sporulation protein AD [Bacillota bacterium]
MSVQTAARAVWRFNPPVGVLGAAAVCGPKEGNGPLAADMDQVFDDLYLGQRTYEQAEQQMQQQACRIALRKAGCDVQQAELLLSGDLINQITPSCFTARALQIPYAGLFTACATIGEAATLGCIAVAGGAARRVLIAAGSHTCTAERQYRYPNEYGCQKPPHSQSTATACGAALLGDIPAAVGICAATIGVVRDHGVCDPFNMGAAMAPAFADTLQRHLAATGSSAADYDLIASGDLGRVGISIARELAAAQGIRLDDTRFGDCGVSLYGDDPSVFAGGSGCGCAAAVGWGYIYRRLQRGEWRRVLLIATGALTSPVAGQQKESIPAVAHAICLCAKGGEC